MPSKIACYRVPVVRGRKPLMPMKLGKAHRFVNAGKAKWRWDNKLKIRYIKLLFEPSGYDTQAIHLGIDHGSMFDGFTVSSDCCQHENIELIHNKTIKEKLSIRRGYRRIRRSRLRHRPIRNNSRTASKRSPTIRSMLEYRMWLVDSIMKIYPISKIIFEQVKYKGLRQKSYTQVHQGQDYLIDHFNNKVGKIKIINSDDTENLRVRLFNGFDLKIKEIGRKNERSFNTHCVDSFTLSRVGLRTIPFFSDIKH